MCQWVGCPARMHDYPFDLTILSALFWLVSASWIVFELRHNIGHGRAKLRLRGSAQVPMIAAFGAVCSSALCYAFDLGLAYPVLERAIVACVGIALGASGLALRFYTARVLGSYFTREITIMDGHRIIRDGPFRYIRHPAYLGSMLTEIGFTCALGPLYAIAFAAVLCPIAYSIRIRAEEDALVNEFGDDYRNYQRRTRRLVPFVY